MHTNPAAHGTLSLHAMHPAHDNAGAPPAGALARPASAAHVSPTDEHARSDTGAGRHVLLSQYMPGGQSLVKSHALSTQLPSKHCWLAMHCAEDEHSPQTPPVMAVGASLNTGQPAAAATAGAHAPAAMSQARPFSHVESSTHANPQTEPLQPAPGGQRPPPHGMPAAASTTQTELVHVKPAGHALLEEHACATHAPLVHSRPAGHPDDVLHTNSAAV